VARPLLPPVGQPALNILRPAQKRFAIRAALRTIERIVLATYNHSSTPMPQWTVARDEVGVRLDKYLAAPDRLGSRTRAVDALARGKIFLNDREVARLTPAPVWLKPTSSASGWIDRAAHGAGWRSRRARPCHRLRRRTTCSS
jgi:hypothetical protein